LQLVSGSQSLTPTICRRTGDPLPRIEQVVADGRALSPMPRLELPSSLSNLGVHWGTVSLKSATKLRFRYRLEGYEPNWVAAGARRSASYERLPSGQYRFRVSTTNDGIWTEAASWEFAVAPPFYFSRWFFGLGALTLAGLVGGAVWLRVSTMHQRYSLVLAERALVSREIHDTLLQGLAAIGMELEAIARRSTLAECEPRVAPAVAAPGGALARRSSRFGRGAPSEWMSNVPASRKHCAHTSTSPLRGVGPVHEQRPRGDALFQRC
jgi:hypothetical protein